MKLLKKINILFLGASLTVLLLLGTTLTIVLNLVAKQQIEEQLDHSYQRIVNQLQAGANINSLPPFFEIALIDHTKNKTWFAETTVKKGNGRSGERFKQLTGIVTINDKTYQIIIRASQLETEDYYESVLYIVLGSILLMIIILYFLNSRISKTIWKDFYLNLAATRSFSVQKQEPIALTKTNILEFDELNNVLVNLTNKVIMDYQNLKQFTEDASHEIQTPLAIISAKLENFLNDQEWSGSQLDTLRSIQASVHRLSRLNKELLLLTKIENNQFISVEKISPGKIIREKIAEFQELIDLQGLTIEMQFADKVLIESNQVLAELLINNLMSNSINHNIPGGLIRIVQNETSLEIWNTGRATIVHPERLFSRFYKENPSSKSVGLGLAIVYKICEVQKWNITYHSAESMHCFRVVFNQIS